MQNFYWYLICTLKVIFGVLPHKAAVRLGSFCGTLMWLICKKKVDKAETRCVRVLGVGVTVARDIVHESYRNIGRAVAETLRLPKIVSCVDRYVTFKNENNLKDALAAGKGVILLLAHLDNWEIANIYTSKKYPLHVIAANQRDNRINELLMHLRSLGGAHNVQKGGGLKGAIRCLRQGDVLCILHDQDAKEKGIVVPFLGEPASTPIGIAKLAAKFGSAVIPTQIYRNEDGFTHTIVFEPPLKDPSGKPFGVDEKTSLAICNERISSWILERPQQWLIWLYPRWASTVPGDR